MINMNDKVLKKLYVEETLKTRKYIGYRLDIALIKLIITAIILTALYLYSNDLIFSMIAGLQVFVILTLFNKIRIDKKIKIGKEKLSQRIKIKKFKNKIFYSDYNELESFIMFYLNQYRYKDTKKIKKYCYSAVKDNETVFVHIMKFYEDASIEKIDIRNLLTSIIDKKYNKNLLITLNDLSEEAKELIENFKDKLNIQILGFDDLYKFADGCSLLSEVYEYNDIENLDKKIHKKTRDILGNIFINKKLIIYLLAAGMFYVMHKIVFQNQLGLYISYYFVILAGINALYRVYVIYTKKKALNK